MSKTKSTSLQTVKTAPPPVYTDSSDASDLNSGSFRDFLDRHRGGIRQGDHGNPNPLLRILPALYEGNFTVGQALAILFSGSYSDLSKEALEEASNTYLSPTVKAIEAISSVIGLPSTSVQDQILQHNALADPNKALSDENPYAESVGIAEVKRPEGTVDLKELNENQLSTFWPEIKESLEGLSETVKNVLFGTGGPPSTLGELLDSIGEGIMEGLKGPISVTFDPNEGVTLDLKIPVGFEINGTSIQIPIFDEEGNLVTGEELKEVFVDAAGRLWDSTGGVLQEIGEIFTDGSGNIVVDIIDAGQAVLEGVGLSEDGALVGTLVEAAIGDFQYDPGTGEIIEEVQASVDDLGLDEGEENGLADTVDEDGDDGLGLTDITKEESEDKPLTPPKGSKYITDKDGNIVRAIGPDGTIYRVDENNEWSVSTSDVVTEEEETTVLPAETTISNGTEEVVIEEDDTRQEESVEIPLDTVQETELTEEEVIEEDDTRQEESVEIPLDTVVETELTEDTVVITDGDDDGTVDGTVDEQPPLTGGDDSGDTDEQPPLTGGDDSGDTDEQPPLTGGDDSGDTDEQPPLTGGDDDETPEEPPLVGPPGADGVDGVDGAAGAAGAPGSRGGYMGGLSYQLPQFVGVQYQPKDYTVELNRIINESLFKGMI